MGRLMCSGKAFDTWNTRDAQQRALSWPHLPQHPEPSGWTIYMTRRDMCALKVKRQCNGRMIPASPNRAWFSLEDMVDGFYREEIKPEEFVGVFDQAMTIIMVELNRCFGRPSLSSFLTPSCHFMSMFSCIYLLSTLKGAVGDDVCNVVYEHTTSTLQKLEPPSTKGLEACARLVDFVFSYPEKRKW
jgi:hypothetical protein